MQCSQSFRRDHVNIHNFRDDAYNWNAGSSINQHSIVEEWLHKLGQQGRDEWIFPSTQCMILSDINNSYTNVYKLNSKLKQYLGD